MDKLMLNYSKRVRLLLSFLMLTLGLFSWASSYAQIYQWKDERGNTHYGDEPPEGVQAKPLNPDTSNLGVEMATPENRSKWKQDIAKPEPPVQTYQPQVTKGLPPKDPNETDLCDGVVGDCFSEEQEQVCLLRYGLECREVYHWKVCLHQKCSDNFLGKLCDSPYYLLDNRLPILGKRDIGRPFPIEAQVSKSDWQCLNQHGFFCDEVAFEKRCQEQYDMSCETLKNWVEDALARCNHNRGKNCSDLKNLNNIRPTSLSTRRKTGFRAPRGGIASEDFLLDSLKARRDDKDQYEELWPVLESLPGLNIRDRRKRYDCNFD